MKVDEFKKKYPTYFKKRNTNKYKAKKTELDNIIFDSKSEGDYYLELKLQQQAGLIESFECQVKESLEAYDKHIFNYFVDFLVYHNDGTKEYIEHKGMSTDLWRAKWKMLEAKYDKEIKRGEIKCSINWNKSHRIKPKKAK